jgi:hypothetical protein
MSMVEFLDKYLTSKGFTKAGDLTVENFILEKTEKCSEGFGVGYCHLEDSFETILFELPVTLSGGVGIYIEYEFVGDGKNYDSIGTYCEIIIEGESDTHKITLYEYKGSCWYV